MSKATVAKVLEISSTSPISFHDAIEKGIARAAKTTRGITGAWVNEEKVIVEAGKITGWRVILKITFVLED